MSEYLKKVACAVLALVLCIGTMTVGTSAAVVGDYNNSEELDELPFKCPHETISDEWTVQSYPDGDTPGAYVRKCVRCGVAGESIEIPPLKLASASLVLTDSLSINYRVRKSLLTEGSYTDPYLVLVMGDETLTIRNYTEDEDNFIFTLVDIAPHRMTDTITSTLYATCYGKVCASVTTEYSVATYCYNTLEKCATDNQAKLRTLLVDLLNYGTASQLYTKHNMENLANTKLTDAQKAWGTATDRELNTVQDTGYVTRENASVTWKSAGLFLQESVALRLKINATNVDGMYAKVLNATGVYTIPSSKFVATEGGYHIYFESLTAAQMSDANYITICDENGAISNTLCYSVESYAYSMQKKSDKESLINLVNAMMRYGDAAKAYVGNDVTPPDIPDGNWTGSY